MFEQAFKVVKKYIDNGCISAAVALIGCSTKRWGPRAYGKLGFLSTSAKTEIDSIFDLASLTKVVSTTTITLQLVEAGFINFTDTLGYLLSETQIPEDKHEITLEHLLTHTSGLSGVSLLYETALSSILKTPLKSAPGEKVDYSCVGFITLGLILEQLSGASLQELFRTIVAEPLEFQDTGYLPEPTKLNRIALTEWDQAKGQFLRGVVHDENARDLRGISGNSGLFGTAPELGLFCEMILQGGTAPGGQILKPASIDLLKTNYTLDKKQPRTLGWVLDRQGTGNAIGHTGFTGTSIWIDFSHNFYAILLTNRVHPTRRNISHVQLRAEFYREFCLAIGVPLYFEPL